MNILSLKTLISITKFNFRSQMGIGEQMILNKSPNMKTIAQAFSA
jgi:hypothetical protein